MYQNPNKRRPLLKNVQLKEKSSLLNNKNPLSWRNWENTQAAVIFRQQHLIKIKPDNLSYL